MGGHGHHEPEIKIPDWRNYKVSECPPLQNLERMLAQRGLKDPWIRNHVWKYPPEVPYGSNARWLQLVKTGSVTGFVFFLGALAVEHAYKFFVPPKDHGHEHH